MSTINPMGMKQWGMLLLLSLLWGSSFFFMKLALVDLPTFTIVLLRVSLAAFCLYLYLKVIGIKLPTDKRIWKVFFYLGFFNNVIPFSLIIYGMTEIASGLASILNATTPLFTIIAAHFATQDEKITFNKLIGITFGVLGVAVLIGVDAFSGLGQSVIAMLACVAAAISYAIASIIGRQFKTLGVAPSVGAFGQVLASSLLLLPIVLLIDQPWMLEIPSFTTINAILALAILSTAVAYVLFFKLIEQAGATNAVLVTLLVPVSAVLLGVIFLSENLTITQLIGMLLIGIGLLAIDGRILAKLKKRTPPLDTV